MSMKHLSFVEEIEYLGNQVFDSCIVFPPTENYEYPIIRIKHEGLRCEQAYGIDEVEQSMLPHDVLARLILDKIWKKT